MTDAEAEEAWHARAEKRKQIEREVFEQLTARGVNVKLNGRLWVCWPDDQPVFDYDGSILKYEAQSMEPVATTETDDDGEVIVERIVDAAATYAAGIPALQAM